MLLICRQVTASRTSRKLFNKYVLLVNVAIGAANGRRGLAITCLAVGGTVVFGRQLDADSRMSQFNTASKKLNESPRIKNPVFFNLTFFDIYLWSLRAGRFLQMARRRIRASVRSAHGIGILQVRIRTDDSGAAGRSRGAPQPIDGEDLAAVGSAFFHAS